MAASDARPIPRKNTAYRVTFPILDADGDPVGGATGLDSEVSIDGAAFADCTNEATEIAGTGSPAVSGMYYLDLTAAEMNGDTVALLIKSAEGKAVPIVLYPEEAGDIRAAVTSIGADAITAAAIAADAVAEIQSGIATAAALATVDTNVDAALVTLGDIEADTQNIQARLPAALVSGRMSSDVRAVNGVTVAGSGIEGDTWGPAA